VTASSAYSGGPVKVPIHASRKGRIIAPAAFPPGGQSGRLPDCANDAEHLILQRAGMLSGIEVALDALACSGTVPAPHLRIEKVTQTRFSQRRDIGRPAVRQTASTPSSIISPMPPMANAATGLDIAIDSMTARGSGSS
jgi:hypothetical protein